MNIAEGVLPHLNIISKHTTTIGVPEEMAGHDGAVGGDKNRLISYEWAAPLHQGLIRRQKKLYSTVFGNDACSTKELLDEFCIIRYVPQQTLQMQENTFVPGLVLHFLEKFDYCSFLLIFFVFEIDGRILLQIESPGCGPFVIGVKQLNGLR